MVKYVTSSNEPISGSDDGKYQEVLEGKTDKQDVADGSESCSSPSDAESPDWLSDVDFGSSDSNSEEGGSDSSDYSSSLELLGKDTSLAEIPSTKDEEELINKFHEEMESIREENDREYQENLRDWCTSSLKRVESLVDKLPQGIRLNLFCNDCEDTVSGSIISAVVDILCHVPVITSAVTRDFQLDSPCASELDDPDNVDAVVNIVRKLFLRGGRVKLDPYWDDGHERLCRMLGEGMMSKFIKKRKQIYDALKSTAYEGITNKDQVQKDDLVVDMDNCYSYTEYPQNSTIEVAKVVNGLGKAVNDLKKVTNDLEVEKLNFKYYIFKIGESIVRVEKDESGKRNYTDVLQGKIEMSFATEVGRISIYLFPGDGNKIKVELADEESKARFSELEDKSSLGKNCLLGGQSVSEAIVKSLEKNGDVSARFSEALGDPFTSMKQVCSNRLPKIDASSRSY